jgi:hypothetical protein
MQMEKKETHKFSVVNNAPTIYRPQEEWWMLLRRAKRLAQEGIN